MASQGRKRQRNTTGNGSDQEPSEFASNMASCNLEKATHIADTEL